ncbi:hypothetical protein ACFWIB_14465 [Streptomyces sp. NPDC127051]|uniref:hypothetical protein n=1 Tax=Streptomyces sp. NPDC127051 TaxID=3347119 RepID=UPI003651BE2B
MNPVQPALDGTIPEPTDYQTWADKVRPTFVRVARSRRRHWLTWQIRKEYGLDQAPDPAHDWGRFMTQLAADGLVQHDGFGYTLDRSVVNAWRGTRGARRGRIS